MSNRATLSAATQDRKARLAQLKSLKRKQPQAEADTDRQESRGDEEGEPRRKKHSPSRSQSPGVTHTYLSGRNYDAETRGPKLGFENAPNANQSTVEAQAKRLEEEERTKRAEEAQQDKPLDLFKLQPKKPNWDLKRDLKRRMEVLDVRTDNAIARMVRDRVQKAQEEATAKRKAEGTAGAGDEPEVGMDGAALVEATRELEREGREEDARMRQEEQADDAW